MISQKTTLAIIAGFLLIFVVFFFFQASNNNSSVIKIGVNQYVAHPILDAVYEGFQEKISDESHITIVFKNSNADAMTCRQINQQFVNSGVDIIVALGTPAAQSAVNISKGNIPVVFGAITDPVGAKLADSLDKPGGNKTGTTNRWPFEEQVLLIKKILPDTKKVGVIINPGEENCVSGMKVIREVVKEQGIELIEVPITNSGEIKTAVDRLINSNVEAILISPSNAVFSALDTVINIAIQKKIPVFGGDETAVQKGSVATYGFSNKDVGVATAQVVLKVLSGEKAGDIPVTKPLEVKLYTNKQVANELNIILSESLE